MHNTHTQTQPLSLLEDYQNYYKNSDEFLSC